MNADTFYSNMEICRVCPRTVNLINLYDPSNKTVLNDLKLIVYIEAEDVTLLPKFICLQCEKSLKNFMDFKKQCEERDKEMRENIRSKLDLKTEISDTEDNEDYLTEMVESLEEDEKAIEMYLEDKESESEATYVDFKEILDSIPSTKPEETSQSDNEEHISSDKFNCIFCTKKFLSWTKLHEHKKAEHKNCTKCQKEFITHHQAMREHFRRVHNKKPKVVSNETFPCKLCEKTFKLKSSIRKHIRSFHNKERPHNCEICDKGFYEIGQFKAHQVTHLEERPFICDFPDCGKTFKSLEYLKSHKICHLPREERQAKASDVHICSYCGKSLSSRNAHDLHVRIHTNEKPHECDVCHTLFRCPASLTSHKRIHTNEKPYPCDKCNSSFRQNSQLKTHQLTHESEKKFSCKICSMSTKFKYSLVAHMRNVHEGQRNVQCKICDEKYFNRSMLVKHMLAKHKDVQ